VTPQEFTEAMVDLRKIEDEASRHIAMDALMCVVLSSLGFAGGVSIFTETKKWYE
jgi:hypothetical protein